MMLAQCQVTHRLGREWRFDAERDGATESVYMEICRRFRDEPDARLSLHSFVARGKEVLGKKPSTWFGPTSGAQVGEALVNAERPDGLRACCFTDGVLYRKPILDALADGASGVIVLLCRKLGVNAFNEECLALHAVRPLRLTWEALNPSMCLSFMVRSPEELEELAAFLSATDAELFEVMDVKQQYGTSPPRKVNEEDEFLVLE